MAVLGRKVKRGAALGVGKVKVGAGPQEELDAAVAALGCGLVQRRLVIPINVINTCVCSEEESHAPALATQHE
jgi:hypothetical protein